LTGRRKPLESLETGSEPAALPNSTPAQGPNGRRERRRGLDCTGSREEPQRPPDVGGVAGRPTALALTQAGPAVRPVFGFRKTGFWLEELAAPYYVFEDAGAPLSPKSPINGTR
jgi:hypothetical protein